MKGKTTILLLVSLFALGGCNGNNEETTNSDSTIKPFSLPNDRFIAAGLVSDANIFYTFDTETKTVNVKRYYALRELFNDNPTPSQSYSEPYQFEFCKRLGDVAVYDNTVVSITHGNYKYAYFYEKTDNGTKGDFYRFSGSAVVDPENPDAEKEYTGISKPAVKYAESNLKYFESVQGKEFVSDDTVQFALETGTKLYYVKARFDANYKVSIYFSADGVSNWERFRIGITLDYLTPSAARNRVQGLFVENYNPDVNTFQIEVSGHFAARVRLVEE